MDEMVWAAATFEAMGTATVSGGERRLQMRQVQTSDDAPPADVLLRFRAAVSRGRIGGPYVDHRAGFGDRRRWFLWYARKGDAADVIEVLWPFLGEAKRSQWLAVCAKTAH